MKNHLSSYLDNAITFLILVVAGITPLLFLSQTTEFFEMPKLLFLVVSTLVILGLWMFSWILKGKVSITRTPLDIPLLIVAAVVIASTYFSISRTSALYGNFPRVHGSAVAWITYILLYFVTVSNLRSLGKIKSFLAVLYGSAVVVSIISILSFFGVFLPIDFAKSVTFTPTGSAFSTIAFLMLLLPLPMVSLARPNKFLAAPIAAALAILFGIVIVLTGSISTYVALLILVALCLLVVKPHQLRKTLPMFLLPVIVMALTLVLAYVPLPGNMNKVQQLEVNFPKEIQLPFSESWKISASAFRDAPFIGTGPSSYLFDFTTYKPAEFNLENFWNFSFDTANNEFLQVLGTLGGFGIAGVIILCLVVLNASRKNMMLRHEEGSDEETHVLLPALAISGVLSIVLLAIHAATLVSVVVTLLVLGVFMVAQRSVREKVFELSMGIKASTSGNRQFDLLPVIFFIAFLVVAVPVLLKTVNVARADFYHRLALAQANKNGTLTYQYLQRAESLNPEADLYRVDMAQTNFALANAIAAQKGPSQASPSGSLTDQDKLTIQTLLSQAINEGRVSVALSPLSSRNWEVLASIYRNITGVAQNALTFSLDAYGRAIQRDPLNPALRISVGGVYYTAKNYDLAVRFFSDAANLKPDYVTAYYNLSITLRDKGDLANAKVVAEQVVNLLKKDTTTPDYKTAVAYLDDLNKRIATAQQAQGQEAPAAQTNSALQNPNLPSVNVSALQNAPSVTPAPAVKANPSANLPAVVTPTPAK